MKKGILKKYRFINKIMNLYFFLNVNKFHILSLAKPYKIRVLKLKNFFQKIWHFLILYLGREKILERRFGYVRVKNFKRS